MQQPIRNPALASVTSGVAATVTSGGMVPPMQQPIQPTGSTRASSTVPSVGEYERKRMQQYQNAHDARGLLSSSSLQRRLAAAEAEAVEEEENVEVVVEKEIANSGKDMIKDRVESIRQEEEENRRSRRHEHASKQMQRSNKRDQILKNRRQIPTKGTQQQITPSQFVVASPPNLNTSDGAPFGASPQSSIFDDSVFDAKDGETM